MHTSLPSGVGITTCQLAKCEYNSGLASKNTNPLASGFFPLSLTISMYWVQLFSDLASEKIQPLYTPDVTFNVVSLGAVSSLSLSSFFDVGASCVNIKYTCIVMHSED
jgi:hypothetical protein